MLSPWPPSSPLPPEHSVYFTQSTMVPATRTALGTISSLENTTYVTSRKTTCSELKNPSPAGTRPTPWLATFLYAGDLTFFDVSWQWGAPLEAPGQGCSHSHLICPSPSISDLLARPFCSLWPLQSRSSLSPVPPFFNTCPHSLIHTAL